MSFVLLSLKRQRLDTQLRGDDRHVLQHITGGMATGKSLSI